MEADEEWSDGSDDALKSGSATDMGHSDVEETRTEAQKQATTNLLLKSDPVHAVLDKIDAELGAMDVKSSSPQSKPSPNRTSPKPTSSGKLDKQMKKSSSNKENKVPLNVDATTSKHTDIKTEFNKLKENEQQYHSDLDSLAAEQIDQKFKEIMKKKRGGYLEDLNIPHSNNETIKTEGFEIKFKSSLVHDKTCQCGCTRKTYNHKKLVTFSDIISDRKPPLGRRKDVDSKSPPRMNQSQYRLLPVKHGGYVSDVDSVKTEDFERKFSDMMVKDTSHDVLKQEKITPPVHNTMSATSKHTAFPKQQLTESEVKKESEKTAKPITSILKRPGTVESIPRRSMVSIYGRTPPEVTHKTPNQAKKPHRARNHSQSGDFNKTSSRQTLNHSQSWDENTWNFPNYCQDSKNSSVTTFEEEDSLPRSNSSKSLSSLDSAFSHPSKPFFFNHMISDPQISRQNSVNSIASGYAAEQEDSSYDPNSRSPSSSDLFEDFQNCQKRKKAESDGDYLNHRFFRVLNWDNNPKRCDTVQHCNSETNTGQKDLIIPEEENGGIPFARHKFNKKTVDQTSSDENKYSKFSSQSSLQSDTSGSLSDPFGLSHNQHSTSLPNISTSFMGIPPGTSPMVPGVSPPLTRVTSQENVPTTGFNMYSPLVHQMTPTAEGMLLNLGFGGSGTLLPQRFLNSWYEKMTKAHIEQQQKYLQQVKTSSQIQIPTETIESPTEKSVLELTLSQDQSNSKKAPSPENSPFQSTEQNKTEKMKATRLARLRDYIESHAGLLKVGLPSHRDFKRQQFRNNKQNSLPSSLKTLSEEEEGNYRKGSGEISRGLLFKALKDKEKQLASFSSYSDSDMSYSSSSSGKNEVDPSLVQLNDLDLKEVQAVSSNQPDNANIANESNDHYNTTKNAEKLEIVNGKMDTDSVDETCREIERESARIQLEMGRERRANSPTHHLNPSSLSLPHTLVLKPEIDDDSLEDKVALEKDVKILREALHRSRLEYRECETNLKDTREKAENARTQLMLTEFKRHNTEKDLDRLNEELEKQKNQSETFSEQIQDKLKDIQEFRSLGLPIAEVRCIKEENTMLKMKSRNLESLELERDELARQLNTGKNDLFHEQKQGRIQKEELQLELESVTSQLEEVQSSRDDLQSRLTLSETLSRKLEFEKNEIIQENKKFKERLKHERSDVIIQTEKEVKDLKLKLQDLEERNKERDDINLKIRDQNIELQQLLAKEEESGEVMLKDHKRTLLNFRKETDSAMMQLRESLFLEKQTALENLRQEIENDRKETVRKNDEKLVQILGENSKIISSKNDEITRLQKLMNKLEEERRQLEQKLQEEVHQQVSQAVARERSVLETERDWALRRERETLVTENNRKIDEISVVLQQEKAVKEEIKQQLKVTQKELEEQRAMSRQAAKDKMVAVARAKEMMREQNSGEIERLKDKLREENKNEKEQLKDSVKSLEEEVEKLQQQKLELSRAQREYTTTLDRTERTVTNEINEECRRSASVLGISPRKVHPASYQNDEPTRNNITTASKSSKYRTPITSSLANLRACNEELRTHLYEIKQEVESLRSLLNKAQKDKEESLETLRRKLEKEKSDEIDHLKERLVREHITQMNRLANRYIADNVVQPDVTLNTKRTNTEETPEYYIRRFEQEMKKDSTKYSRDRPPSPEFKHINDLQQEEINRLEREIQKISLNRSSNRKPPRPHRDVKKEIPVDKAYDKLQYKLQQFDTEPSRLQSNLYTGSVPDLSNPGLYRQQVPLKARLSAERDDIGANFMERPKFNEFDPDPELSEIFLQQNHKLSDMNKLQNTLTNQNKELLELERAYNQLNRSYNQRSASPSLNFRSSR